MDCYCVLVIGIEGRGWRLELWRLFLIDRGWNMRWVCVLLLWWRVIVREVNVWIWSCLVCVRDNCLFFIVL